MDPSEVRFCARRSYSESVVIRRRGLVPIVSIPKTKTGKRLSFYYRALRPEAHELGELKCSATPSVPNVKTYSVENGFAWAQHSRCTKYEMFEEGEKPPEIADLGNNLPFSRAKSEARCEMKTC